MPKKMKFILSFVIGAGSFTALLILSKLGILGSVLGLGAVALIGGGLFLLSFIIFSFIKKTTKEGLFLQKIYQGQQKINRLRSLTYRLQDDSVRKKGEELTTLARSLFNLIKKKHTAESEMELDKFFVYFDKAIAVIETYIEVSKTNAKKSKELVGKIDALFNIVIKVISQYIENITDDRISDLEKQINIAEKTAELDHYLQNDGIVIDNLDLE